MNQTDIQSLIKRMEAEIELLEIKIQDSQAGKRHKRLEKYPFFTPFIKAVILTAVVLAMYAVSP